MTKASKRMVKSIIGSMVLAGLVIFAVSTADAQQLCGPRDAAIAQLAGKHDERVVGRGIVDGGRQMIEIFQSETGTWTVMVTDTKGNSCLVANGQSWTATPLKVGEPI